MSYSVSVDQTGPWLVIDYEGEVDEDALVAARTEAVSLNEQGEIRDFILDFGGVTAFVLGPESARRISEIDRSRAEVVTNGRCAIVADRETVEIGTSFLGSVSPLGLDFRTFRRRTDAEAWLRGELADPPPPLPRRRRDRGD